MTATTQMDAFQAAKDSAARAQAAEASAVSQLKKLFAEGKVPSNDVSFVASLLRAADGRGLTSKQADWVTRLAERYSKPKEPVATKQLPSMAGVVALLARARDNGLKFPKLWLKMYDIRGVAQDLRITIAGAGSKTPGYVVLTDGERFGNNKYFGRISPAGELTIGRDAKDFDPQLDTLLTQLANDPAKVASEYGHLTGHCCFCSLPLSDERSVAVGYGRICAGKFALPWGAS